MNKYFLATMFAMLFTSVSFAQHTDIEFGFEDPSSASPVFEILLDEFTEEGIAVAEGEFEGSGAFRTADSPGFITPVEEDENLTVGVGDQVFIRVLDASADDSPTKLVSGYVGFWTPDGGLQSFDSSFGTLSIESNTIGSDDPTFSDFTGDSADGPTDLFLAVGSDGTALSDVPPSLGEENVTLGPGEIHNHLAFDLSGDLAATNGAVSLLLQFSVVRRDTGDVIDSDPFFLIFNNGLSEDEGGEFEAALLAFGLDEGGEAPLLGDVNIDGVVDFFDISPFIDLLSNQEFQAEADFDQNEVVDFFDISGFILALSPDV